MKHESLKEFPVVISVPLQWGDQDAFGHVNNTRYLRWAESSRIEYLTRIGLWKDGPDGVGPILAGISCDYRRPLTFPDTIRIGARVTKIGNSSFRMEHRIISEGLKVIAADLHSTLVVFDYPRNKSVPLPEPVRHAIEKLEGHAFERA